MLNPHTVSITHQEAWSVVRALSAACVERNARVPAHRRIDPMPSLCPLRFGRGDARYIVIGGTVMKLCRGGEHSCWLEYAEHRWEVSTEGMESLIQFVGTCHRQPGVASRMG